MIGLRATHTELVMLLNTCTAIMVLAGLIEHELIVMLRDSFGVHKDGFDWVNHVIGEYGGRR